MAQSHILEHSKSLIDAGLKEGSLATRSLKKRIRFFELIIQNLLLICGLASIVTTIGILYTLGENSLLFFRQHAFEQAKYEAVIPAVIMNMDEEVTLMESLSADATIIPLILDERASQPFERGQTLSIGDELIYVRDVSRTRLEVERAYAGTSSSTHEAGSTISLKSSLTVLLAEDISATETEIPLPLGAAAAFEESDTIRIEQEVMLVLTVDEDENKLLVERAAHDTNAVRHHENLPVFVTKTVALTEFFSGTKWNPQLGRLGILPLLNATLMTTFFALILALPVGLGIAIYLCEYATTRFRSYVKPILELLVGVPTVVYGYFALTWLTPLLQDLIGVQVKQFNTLSAGLVMGIMIVPTIASISEDALSSVPGSLRQASYALGATRFETIHRMVLPAAVSGVMAAFLLGISRAVGETMIVALAAGAGPNFTFNPLEGAETMTGHIVRISGGDISYNTIDYNSLFAIGLLLFVLTMIFNIFSGIVTRRFREVY